MAGAPLDLGFSPPSWHRWRHGCQRLLDLSLLDEGCLVAHEQGPKLRNGWACRVGCYDRHLKPLWERTISFPLDPGSLRLTLQAQGAAPDASPGENS